MDTTTPTTQRAQDVAPTFTPDRPIVITGLMGAGKSSIGKRLAKALHMPFYDSDNEISEAAACSISDIFEIYGEDLFRDLENRVMRRLLEDEAPAVIATGGGAFINDTIRAMVQDKAISIWLKADLEVLLERVSRKKTRPLLEKGNKREILAKLMEDRTPYYSQATLTVKSDEGVHENVVEDAIEELNRYYAAREGSDT